LAIQQRVLPFYRAPFFDELAGSCPAGMELFAGLPRTDEAIETVDHLDVARLVSAKNIHLLRGSMYICLQPGFQHWLENFQPDALIIEANPRYLSTPSAIRWMKSRHKPVIGWGLGAPGITGSFSGLRTQSRVRFLNQLDAVIAYSRQGAEEYAACGIPESKIFVAPNSASFRPENTPLERPSGHEGRPRVLFVGRLQVRKRLDLLFNACAALPVNLQPEITIVGDGPDRAMLEKIAAERYPSAVFVGTKTGSELDPFFQRADLFVLPGTGGLAVQQAMSFGLPVVVAEGDGTQSQLVRPENGWLVNPDNLSDLTRTLASALSDPAALRKKGLESFRIVRDEINIEKMVDVFLTAIRSVSQP
jgi:glycosyltransferase involved in cell wall biosynthesis